MLKNQGEIRRQIARAANKTVAVRKELERVEAPEALLAAVRDAADLLAEAWYMAGRMPPNAATCLWSRAPTEREDS